MDLDELKAGKDKRLELVRQKAAEEKATAEAKIAKTKKTAKRSAPFVIVAIILIAAVGLFASHMIKMQNYPARAFYDYVSKNGTYSEKVNLPFYTQESRDTGTPIIFSGYVTWQFTESEGGVRDYYWGHYHTDREWAERDFSRRIDDYH